MSPTAPERLVGIRVVRTRYNDVSARTIDRWIKQQLIRHPIAGSTIAGIGTSTSSIVTTAGTSSRT